MTLTEPMTLSDRIEAHKSRCEPQLLRLWMLARGEASAVPPRQVSAEVREATNAVIAEAEAAGRAALAATAGNRGEPEAGIFLWVRLTRLAEAADEAVRVARSPDITGLRRCLHRFEALTSAMWTVQHAVYGVPPAAMSRPVDWPAGFGDVRTQPPVPV
jgi:hypothetical protein